MISTRKINHEFSNLSPAIFLIAKAPPCLSKRRQVYDSSHLITLRGVIVQDVKQTFKSLPPGEEKKCFNLWIIIPAQSNQNLQRNKRFTFSAIGR